MRQDDSRGKQKISARTHRQWWDSLWEARWKICNHRCFMLIYIYISVYSVSKCLRHYLEGGEGWIYSPQRAFYVSWIVEHTSRGHQSIISSVHYNFSIRRWYINIFSIEYANEQLLYILLLLPTLLLISLEHCVDFAYYLPQQSAQNTLSIFSFSSREIRIATLLRFPSTLCIASHRRTKVINLIYNQFESNLYFRIYNINIGFVLFLSLPSPNLNYEQ